MKTNRCNIKTKTNRLIILLLLFFPLSLVAQNRMYVSINAEGNNTGGSWYDAYTSFDDAYLNAKAFKAARPNEILEVWVAFGEYPKLSSTQNDTAFYMIPGVLFYGGFRGTENSIEERNFSLGYTILSGGDSCRILVGDIPLTSDTAFFDGFKFEYGNSTHFSDRNGAGVILKGNAFLSNCWIENCSGDNALYIDNSAYNPTTKIMNLSNVYVQDNNGTGIYVKSDYAHLYKCTSNRNNSSPSGYGIYIDGNNGFLEQCIIFSNTGTGVSMHDGKIWNSIINNNTQKGCITSNSDIINCIFANNDIFGIESSFSNIVNCNIINNGSKTETNAGGANSSNDKYYNSIFWNNANASEDKPFYANSGTTISHCASSATLFGTNNILLSNSNIGTSDSVNYPMFLFESKGVGSTYTYTNLHTQSYSVFVNAGITPPSITMPNVDLDNNNRIYDENENSNSSDDKIDIGVYEAQYTLFPTSITHKIIYVKENGNGKKDGSSWDNALEHLSDAINLARKLTLRDSTSYSIWVSAGTYLENDISNKDYIYPIYPNINIYGSFVGNESYNYDPSQRTFKKNSSILDGGNTNRIFKQNKTFFSGESAIIDGFTIQNGYRKESSTQSARGVGVFLINNVKIANCLIQNNFADGYSAMAVGAGLYLTNADTIVNCVIYNNKSNYRTAGIYSGSGSIISNSIIANNQSRMGVTAITANNSFLENLTIVRNLSTNGSYSIAISENSTFRNNIVWGNQCESEEVLFQDYSNNIIDHSAIQNYTPDNDASLPNNSESGIVSLNSNNDGDDAESTYPRFVFPTNTAGNLDLDFYELNNWSLKSNSDLIDAGDDNCTYPRSCDLAMKARKTGSSIDMGTFELAKIPLTKGGIVYITTDGTGDGSSWNFALSDINYASETVSRFNLDSAQTDNEKIKIWIKKGTYYGDGIGCNPAFRMQPKVNVYGSFVGNETPDYDVTKRYYRINPTILDGQHIQRVLLQDGDIIYKKNSVSSHFGFFPDSSATWDGFIILNGYSDCEKERENSLNEIRGKFRNRGAGVYLQENGFLNNCQILNNETTMKSSYSDAITLYEGWGAGIFLSGKSILHNCIIKGNKSASRCGGVYCDHNSTLLNCLISNNESYNVSNRGGAGLYSFRSYIYNTTIVNNKLKQYTPSSYAKGGGVFLNTVGGFSLLPSDSSYIYNSVIWGNTFEYFNGTIEKSQVQALNGSQNIHIKHCAIENYTLQYNNTICSDIIPLNSDNYGFDASSYYPLFIFPSDSIGVYEGISYNSPVNWSISSSSALLNSGSDHYYLNILNYPQDIVGNPRIYDSSIDIGAYEYTNLYSQITSDTIYVTQTGCGNGTSWHDAYGDFQIAIDSAYARNQRYGVNKVNVWVAGGDYYGNYTDTNAFTMREGVNVYGGFYGYQETSLDERDPERYPSYLKGNNMHRVLYQAEDFSDTTIWDGFVITEGKVVNENGGGAYLRGNSILLNCTISNNTTVNGIGGGVYGENGATIYNTTFTNNTAKNGSAVALDSASIYKCIASYNTVTDPDGFTIVAKSHSAMVDSAVVTFNIGGGIDAYSASNTRRTIIAANTGLGARGNGSVIFNNLLINNNGKGGLQLSNLSKSYSNTIVNNAATDTCAGIILDNSTMINTLVWGNERNNKSSQIYALNHSIVKYSAVQDTLLTRVVNLIDTAVNNITLDSLNVGNQSGKSYPFFSSPCDYKGVTTPSNIASARWGLQPYSSCYNKGSMVLEYSAEEKDLNGNGRIDFGRIDIGAYELQWPRIYLYKTVFVSEGGRGNQTGVTWEHAMPYLQDAIEIAEITHYPIWVSKGNYYGDSLDNEAFLIKGGVEIYGSFEGNEASNYDLKLRDFTKNASILHGQDIQRVLNQNVEITDTAIYDGFTITGGYTSGNGAGAYLKNNVILRYCNFNDNDASGNGGAVYSEKHNEIYCSYFQNNGGNQGGAIYGDSLTLKNNIISNNEASAEGGGLFLNNNSLLINNTIVRNLSHGDGGGIYSNALSKHNTLTNNVLWANQSIISSDTSFNQIRLSSIDSTYFTYNAAQHLDTLKFVGQKNISVEKDNFKFDLLNRKYVLFYLDNEITGRTNATAIWSPSIASSLLNAGNSSADIGAFDINNKPRIQGAEIDMGAIENQLIDYNYEIIYVKPGEVLKHEGKSWDDALASVMDAVLLAYVSIDTNTGRHPLVWVAQGNYTENRSKNSAFLMFEDVQVTGGFVGNEAPDYDVTQLRRDNTILSASNSNQRVLEQFEDFSTPTFWKNFAINKGCYKGDGAGVYLRKNGGLDNWLISNTKAIGDTTKGGGIYASDSAIIKRIRINNCSAANGGGVYMNNSVLSHAAVTGNSATLNGGGIYTKKSYIVNAYVNYNKGGGIYALDSTYLINNTIVQNKVTGTTSPITTGSGVLCTDSTTILNCIVWGNTRESINYSNQITYNVANVTYTAIQGDHIRSGHDGNLLLEAQNSNTSFEAYKYYPEFIPYETLLPLSIYSSVINIGSPILPSLPTSIDFSLDAHYYPRVYNERIDLGANEFHGFKKTLICSDSICQQNSSLTFHCENNDFSISAKDANIVGTYNYRDTIQVNDTVFVNYFSLKVKAKPVSNITVHDNFLSAITNITDCISGIFTGIPYWSTDSGKTYVTTTPSRKVQKYYLYEEFDAMSTCHTDTLTFQVFPECNVNFSEDTANVCLSTPHALTYFGIASNYTWKMDSTIAIYDNISQTITPIAVGQCLLTAFSPSCINDTVTIIVRDVPKINEESYTINDSYIGSLQPTLEIAIPGSWGGNYTGLSINNSTGEITANAPEIGIYPFSFTSLDGCSDTVFVIVGSSSCSFQVGNVAEISALRDAVNTGGIFTLNGVDYDGSDGFAGCTISLSGNIDFLGSTWTPMGTLEHPFRATFSGLDRGIARYKINAPTSDNVGFFGYIEGATITRVRFSCDSINSNRGYIIGNNNVGSVVGYAKNSTIRKCGSTSPVTGNSNVGAFVGLAEGTTISNCLNSGTISSTSGPAGGIAGKSNTLIEDCMNSGWIYSKNANCYVGGICGETSDTIQYSFNAGVIGIVPRTDSTHIGNIVGKSYSSTVLYHTYYDKQMTPFDFEATNNASIISSAGYLTKQTTGNQITSTLNAHNCWSFANDVYPTPNALNNAGVQQIAQSVLLLDDNSTTDNFNQNASLHSKSQIKWVSKKIFSISQTNNLLTFASSGTSIGNITTFDSLHRTCIDQDTALALVVMRETNSTAFHATRTIPLYMTSAIVKLFPLNSNYTYYNGNDSVTKCYGYPSGLIAIPSNYTESYIWHNNHNLYTDPEDDAIVSTNFLDHFNNGWWQVELNHPTCGLSKDSIYVTVQDPQTSPIANAYYKQNNNTILITSFPQRIICDTLSKDTLIFAHPKPGNYVPTGCSLEYRIITPDGNVIIDWNTWTDTSTALKFAFSQLGYGRIIFEMQHDDCSNSCGNKIVYSANIRIINPDIYFEPQPGYSNICIERDSLWLENVICQEFKCTDSAIVYGDVIYMRNNDTLFAYKVPQTTLHQVLDTATHAEFPSIIGIGETSLIIRQSHKISAQKTPNGIALQIGDKIIINGYWLEYNTNGGIIDLTRYTSSDTSSTEWRIISNPKFAASSSLNDYAICYNKTKYSMARWDAHIETAQQPYLDTALWYFSTDHGNNFTALDIIGTDSLISGLFKVGRVEAITREYGLDLRVFNVTHHATDIDTLLFMVEAYWNYACTPTRDTITLIIFPQTTAGSISGPATVCEFEETDTLQNIISGTLAPDIFKYRWQIKTESMSAFNTAPGRNDTAIYAPGLLAETTTFRRILYNNACGYYFSDTVTIQTKESYEKDSLFTSCKGEIITLPEWGTINTDTMQTGKVFSKSSNYNNIYGCDSSIHQHLVILRSNEKPLFLTSEDTNVCKNSSTIITLHNASDADQVNWYAGNTLISSGNDTILEIAPDSSTTYSADAIYNTKWNINSDCKIGETPIAAEIEVGDIINIYNTIIKANEWTEYVAEGGSLNTVKGIVYIINDSVVEIANYRHSSTTIPWGYNLDDSVGVLIPNIPLYSTNPTTDNNGYSNTNSIIEYNLINDMMWNATNCAARWVQDSLGTDWHLPSVGETDANYILGPSLINSFNIVTNNTYESIGNQEFWTSTQHSATKAWVGKFSADWAARDKTESHYVYGVQDIKINTLKKFKNTNQCINTKSIQINLINETVTPGSITDTITICQGNSAPTITSTSIGSGGNGTYQWQYTYSLNTPFANAAGINTGADYTPDTIIRNTYFRRAWIADCGYFYSDTAIVILNPIYRIEYEANICKGEIYDNFGWQINTTDSTAGTKTYTRNLTSVSGCDSTRVLTLNILQPNINVSGPSVVAAGNYATLVAQFNTDSVVWFRNGVIIPNSNNDTIHQLINEDIVFTAKAILDTTWLGNGDFVKTASDFEYGDIVTTDNMIVKPEYWHQAEAEGKEIYGIIYFNDNYDQKVNILSPTIVPNIYWMNSEKIEDIPNADFFYEDPQSDMNGRENALAMRAYADTASVPNTSANNLQIWIKENLGEEWYLPAAGEAYNLYFTKNVINITLDTLNYDTLYSTSTKTWTSTEYSDMLAWSIDINRNFTAEEKANRYFARGVTKKSYSSLTKYCNPLECDAQTIFNVTADLSFSLSEDTLHICSNAQDTLRLSRKVSGTWSSSDNSVATISGISGVSDSLAIITPQTTERDSCYIFYTSTYGLVKDSTLIIINPLPVATFASDTIFLCKGSTSTLSPTITPSGINSKTYQWQTFTSGTWNNCGTSATYTTPSITNTTAFRVIITGDGCTAASPYDEIILKNFIEIESTIKVKVNDNTIIDE